MDPLQSTVNIIEVWKELATLTINTVKEIDDALEVSYNIIYTYISSW